MPSGVPIVSASPIADGSLHRMLQAFIDHDALQSGYCTPGQRHTVVWTRISWMAGLEPAILPSRSDAFAGTHPGRGYGAEVAQQIRSNVVIAPGRHPCMKLFSSGVAMAVSR